MAEPLKDFHPRAHLSPMSIKLRTGWWLLFCHIQSFTFWWKSNPKLNEARAKLAKSFSRFWYLLHRFWFLAICSPFPLICDHIELLPDIFTTVSSADNEIRLSSYWWIFRLCKLRSIRTKIRNGMYASYYWNLSELISIPKEWYTP